MEKGLERRDRVCIKEVFNKYSRQKDKSIDQEKLIVALRELDAFIDPGISCDEMMQYIDKNRDGDIDLNEFTRAVQNPRPSESLVRSLPLHQLLVDCLPRRDDAEYLRGISMLTKVEIDAVVHVFGIGLTRILGDTARQAQITLSMLEKNVSKHKGREAKFQLDVPPCSWGNIKDFHRGLTSRVGACAHPEPLTSRVNAVRDFCGQG
jgi:hypothetical protein